MLITEKILNRIIDIIEDNNKTSYLRTIESYTKFIQLYEEKIKFLTAELAKERQRADLAIDQLLHHGICAPTVMPEKMNLKSPIICTPESAEDNPADFFKKLENQYGEINKVGEDDGAEDVTVQEKIQ